MPVQSMSECLFIRNGKLHYNDGRIDIEIPENIREFSETVDELRTRLYKAEEIIKECQTYGQPALASLIKAYWEKYASIY